MKSSVFLIFGRFQPPTIGHERLFTTAKEMARREQADVAVFVSHTQDKKNPLSYKDKVAAIRNSVRGLIIGPDDVRTPPQALTWAFDKGYRTITMLVGDDREEGFEKLAGSWQKHEDPKQTATVKVASLPRTGSMDASKVSGTVARRYAQQGDLDNFKKILISGAQSNAIAKRFMQTIQQQMGTLQEVVIMHPQKSQAGYAKDDSADSPDTSVPPENDTKTLDPKKRVPEDTEDNKSIVIIHPSRRLKFDAKEKAKQLSGEEEALPTSEPMTRI